MEIVGFILMFIGISFHVLAPEWKKLPFENSKFCLGMSISSIFLVEYPDISDLVINLPLRLSGQRPFIILYVIMALSYLIRLETESHLQIHPSSNLALSINVWALSINLPPQRIIQRISGEFIDYWLIN